MAHTGLGPAEGDRIAGALLGLAAGDALGAPYEFTSGTEQPEMVGGGGLGWEPGEWTDDTQMALCVAEVTASGTVDCEAIGERFLEWFHTSPKDAGIQTGRVLGQASRGGELTAIATQYFENHPRGAAGNGSLMRTAPVALAHLGDDDAIAESAMKVSGLTHGDPLAGEACVLWCIAIDRAIREARLDGVRDGLELLPSDRQSFWDTALSSAETKSPQAFRSNGFVVTALQAAYASVVQTPQPDTIPCEHLQAALRTAISIGDDTDTVAAIAGSLLGARWGSSAILLEWRRLLHGWPGYDGRDLVRLAVLSSRKGVSDDTGWPAADSLLDYYQRQFDPSGLVLPLPSDKSVLVGDVAALRGAGGEADVIVSLCRVGQKDVRPHAEHHEIWLIDEPDHRKNSNLDFVLRDLSGFVGERRREGKTVFIHCVRAESRTPAVAAAYLMSRGQDPDTALEEVRRVLPRSRPNRGFEHALRRILYTEGRPEAAASKGLEKLLEVFNDQFSHWNQAPC